VTYVTSDLNGITTSSTFVTSDWDDITTGATYVTSDLNGITTSVTYVTSDWNGITMDANGITDLLNNLGATAMREGNFDGALERYEECLDLYRNAGNRSGVAIVLHNLADIYCRQGRFDSGEPLARESLDIAGELSIKALLGPAHLALGLCAEARSKSEAITDLSLSCQNSAEEADIETALDSLKELALCQADIGEMRWAEECLKLAEELESHVGAGYRPIRTETALEVAETLGMTLPPMASRESTSILKDVLSLTQSV
jgi:tetratricopeptide (TPR) repeat protein